MHPRIIPWRCWLILAITFTLLSLYILNMDNQGTELLYRDYPEMSDEAHFENSGEEIRIERGDILREHDSFLPLDSSREDMLFETPDNSLHEASHQPLKERQDKSFNLTIWSQDYTVGPVNDLKLLLQGYGVRFIDNSLSSHCMEFGTCASRLPFITPYNGFEFPVHLMDVFVNDSSRVSEISQVDAFLCFYPAAMCELFTPFKKPIVIVTASRFNAGRTSSTRWQHWRDTLLALGDYSRHVIAATNQYDVEHVNYYTGIRPQLLQPYMNYIESKPSFTYANQDFLFITGSRRRVLSDFFSRLNYSSSMGDISWGIARYQDVYSTYKAQYVSRHPAVVYIPHLVTSWRFLELYRMNMPIFVPSLSLMVTWQAQARVIIDRTFPQGGTRGGANKISGVLSLPDPEDNTGTSSIGFWLSYLDYYNMPGVGQFHSLKHLVQQLSACVEYPQTLSDMSSKLNSYNMQMKEVIRSQWVDILENIDREAFRNKHMMQ